MCLFWIISPCTITAEIVHIFKSLNLREICFHFNILSLSLKSTYGAGNIDATNAEEYQKMATAT